ncbi:hypothetical protein ACFYO1_23845 [Nocardia sp. NPDC006044]|uniref:hypothetical protein n=1 Tax=Nocardia sp. NPDC006044 TaxID=3364306 RepID=UPI0036C4D1F9
MAGPVPGAAFGEIGPIHEAAPVAAGQEQCSEEFTDAKTVRILSQLCLQPTEGGVVPRLKMHCQMQTGFTSAWGDSYQCNTWDPSYYTITAPGDQEVVSEFASKKTGSKNNPSAHVSTDGSSYPCKDGLWKLRGHYGAEVGTSNNFPDFKKIEARRGAEFTITCP